MVEDQAPSSAPSSEIQEVQEQLRDAVDGIDSPPEVIEPGEAPKRERRERKHMSKEEWTEAGKDPEKWKPREKFEEHGSFYEKIDTQHKYIKNLEKKLKKLEQKAQHEEYNRYNYERNQYLTERDSAILNGRLDKYYEANNRLEQLRGPEQYYTEEYEMPEETIAAVNERDRVDDDFMERNKHWWNEDSIENAKMVQEARDIADQLQPLVLNGRFSIYDIVDHVENEMAKRYPHKFDYEDDTHSELNSLRDEINSLREDTRKPKAAAVETNSISRSKFSLKDLPADVRDIYSEAVKRGMTKLTPKQYLTQYKRGQQ